MCLLILYNSKIQARRACRAFLRKCRNHSPESFGRGMPSESSGTCRTISDNWHSRILHNFPRSFIPKTSPRRILVNCFSAKMWCFLIKVVVNPRFFNSSRTFTVYSNNENRPLIIIHFFTWKRAKIAQKNFLFLWNFLKNRCFHNFRTHKRVKSTQKSVLFITLFIHLRVCSTHKSVLCFSHNRTRAQHRPKRKQQSRERRTVKRIGTLWKQSQGRRREERIGTLCRATPQSPTSRADRRQTRTGLYLENLKVFPFPR